ncbi:class I lanthipeptide [Kordia algicida OT-1]|uniref:Uncharacterized protein n=1 Tax=Kordia algicida OT-1 TaxID=391587 RepID=A9DNM5_9FLAO|nr:class I lanthipeptide [Kordia algicida]EDP97228.1 hypothetical protein KAOT1_18737 [Kordia algicida OT-1]
MKKKKKSLKKLSLNKKVVSNLEGQQANGGTIVSQICPINTVWVCPIDTLVCPIDTRLCPIDTRVCPIETLDCPSVACPTDTFACPY